MKTVGNFKTTLRGVGCERTKEFVILLRKKGKKPYIITHKTYFSVRFHHKGKYLVVIPTTGKWNIEQSRGKRKWFHFNYIDKFWDYIQSWGDCVPRCD